MLRPCILVTGGSGFVGRSLLKRLLEDDVFQVKVALRQHFAPSPTNIEHLSTGDLSKESNWSEILKGVDCVIHLAARAHILNDDSDNPLEEFRKINTYATENLAKKAADCGVKRFIFVSTIGVNGAFTAPGVSFSELDEPHPHNDYAQSKWEAEQRLRKIALISSMEVVIIRPPLIYGGNATGNFGVLLKILYSNWPLPLGSVKNSRSFISLSNFTDFIIQTIDHHAAANQTFLVSDGDDISTTELLKLLASGMGKSARLFAVPNFILEFGSYVLGKPSIYKQLCCSLRVDISKASKQMNWTPKISAKDGLIQAAIDFINNKRG